MIPAGVFNQGSGGLSKEIWISWGTGYTNPEQGVYVNAIDYTITNTPIALKNALGNDVELTVTMNNIIGSGFDQITYAGGVLDIINRRNLFINRVNEGTGFDSVGEVHFHAESPITGVTVSVLRGRGNANPFNAPYNISWDGGSQSFIGTALSTIKDKMEIDSDYNTVENVSFDDTTPLKVKMANSDSYVSFRAIVIQLK